MVMDNDVLLILFIVLEGKLIICRFKVSWINGLEILTKRVRVCFYLAVCHGAIFYVFGLLRAINGIFKEYFQI